MILQNIINLCLSVSIVSLIFRIRALERVNPLHVLNDDDIEALVESFSKYRK